MAPVHGPPGPLQRWTVLMTFFFFYWNWILLWASSENTSVSTMYILVFHACVFAYFTHVCLHSLTNPNNDVDVALVLATPPWVVNNSLSAPVCVTVHLCNRQQIFAFTIHFKHCFCLTFLCRIILSLKVGWRALNNREGIPSHPKEGGCARVSNWQN